MISKSPLFCRMKHLGLWVAAWAVLAGCGENPMGPVTLTPGTPYVTTGSAHFEVTFLLAGSHTLVVSFITGTATVLVWTPSGFTCVSTGGGITCTGTTNSTNQMVIFDVNASSSSSPTYSVTAN